MPYTSLTQIVYTPEGGITPHCTALICSWYGFVGSQTHVQELSFCLAPNVALLSWYQLSYLSSKTVLSSSRNTHGHYLVCSVMVVNDLSVLKCFHILKAQGFYRKQVIAKCVCWQLRGDMWVPQTLAKIRLRFLIFEQDTEESSVFYCGLKPFMCSAKHVINNVLFFIQCYKTPQIEESFWLNELFKSKGLGFVF